MFIIGFCQSKKLFVETICLLFLKNIYVYHETHFYMKKPKKKLTITLDPDVVKHLEDGGFNKSRFINKILEAYLQKEKLK
jgi:hypothetical protein